MELAVHQIHIHYETRGTGRPVLLLHGNGESGHIFEGLAEKLAETCRVIVPDSRCHGESSRTEKISYELMADDMIALIRGLRLEKPTVYGFSDGGIVGLLMAVKEPDLLSRLLISGANRNPLGLKISCLAQMAGSYLKDRDPLTGLMLTGPHIRRKDLEKIRIPVAVLAGEKDVVREPHTRNLAACISGSSLEIIPGEDHSSYVLDNEKLYRILRKYLG